VDPTVSEVPRARDCATASKELLAFRASPVTSVTNGGGRGRAFHRTRGDCAPRGILRLVGVRKATA